MDLEDSVICHTFAPDLKTRNKKMMQNPVKQEKYDRDAVEEHLTHLGSLFLQAHTIGLENIHKEPLHLSSGFVGALRDIRGKRYVKKTLNNQQ